MEMKIIDEALKEERRLNSFNNDFNVTDEDILYYENNVIAKLAKKISEGDYINNPGLSPKDVKEVLFKMKKDEKHHDFLNYFTGFIVNDLANNGKLREDLRYQASLLVKLTDPIGANYLTQNGTILRKLKNQI